MVVGGGHVKGSPATRAVILCVLFGLASCKEAGARQRALLERRSSTDSEPSTLEARESHTAVFAAGCFWGVELAFARLPGVLSTEVGYVGGNGAPNYRAVSTGTTGHAEAVRVGYDPSVVSYSDLLGVFFDVHDPTQLNRQGNDVGTQYRSALFPQSAEQRSLAEAAIRSEVRRLGVARIATSVEPASDFTRAEEYHQAYLVKGGQSASKGETTPIRCYG